jgi:radical SAM protein with 4Fe4S-binding SPASM domain
MKMIEYYLKELKIEVTYKCPLACVHCSSNAGIENTNEMSYNNCRHIVTEAKDMGVSEIAFSGGEPLIWPNIIEIVHYSSTLGINTTIYTSGYIDNAPNMIFALNKAGLKRAVFSLYSSIEQDHNRITRIFDSFQRTLNSIDICYNNDIIPEVHFVALSGNYHCIADVVKLVEKHGVKRTSILRFVPQGRGVLLANNGVLSHAQNLELQKTIISLRNAGHDIRTGSPLNVLWLNREPKCLAGQDRLIIAPDLSIYPCDAFKQIKAIDIIGTNAYSTLDGFSLFECWQRSNYLNEVRAAINAKPTDPCASCEVYFKCKAGCLAQKYIHYNSLQKNPDPICLR